MDNVLVDFVSGIQKIPEEIKLENLGRLDEAELSPIDTKQALFIKHNNCKLIKHKSSSHLLTVELKEKGVLKDLILNSLKCFSMSSPCVAGKISGAIPNCFAELMHS